MNFTYAVKQPPDRQWGAIQPDGSWTGMVNELQYKRADIGIKIFNLYPQSGSHTIFLIFFPFGKF